MNTPDPYSRIYWRIADEYPEVYADDHAFALYCRLLPIGDAAWPSSAALPYGVKPSALRKLTAASEHRPDGSLVLSPLVTLQAGQRFRIRGMDKSRESRQQSAQVGANARWGRTANAQRTHSERNADAMHIPSPTEPSLTEPSIRIANEEKYDAGLASLKDILDSTGARPLARGAKRNGHPEPKPSPETDEQSAARCRLILADPDAPTWKRDVAQAQLLLIEQRQAQP